MTEQSAKLSAEQRDAESLSALMDSEANEIELHRVLARASDPELRARWQRYHVASAALRNDVPQMMQLDISAAVSVAIDAEPSHGRYRQVLRAAGSFAVAASVTVAVLVGVRVYNTQLEPEAGTQMAAAEQSAPQGVELPAYPLQRGGEMYASYGNKLRVSEPAGRAVDAQERAYVRQMSPYAQNQLRMHLLQHTEQAAANANHGMIPYARVPEFNVQR